MKYERVTDDTKLAMLEQRQTQLEQEHFAHEMRVSELEAQPDADTDEVQAAIKQSRESQAVIERALGAVIDKRDVIRASQKRAPRSKSQARREAAQREAG